MKGEMVGEGKAEEKMTEKKNRMGIGRVTGMMKGAGMMTEISDMKGRNAGETTQGRGIQEREIDRMTNPVHLNMKMTDTEIDMTPRIVRNELGTAEKLIEKVTISKMKGRNSLQRVEQGTGLVPVRKFLETNMIQVLVLSSVRCP